jgi:DNA uptake protein ComE-like DNA-binding protein
MMMVVTVMAVALHLNQTLRVNTVRCQMFRLQEERKQAENGLVWPADRWAVGLVALMCVAAQAQGQNQDRDSRGVPKTSSLAPAPDQRVDINHASVDQLLKVPGMTRGWAVRIVRFRPYRTKQDLFEKGVVSSQVYDRIKDFVIAHHDKQ